MTTRRKFIGGCAALVMMPSTSVRAAQALRIGMTPALLHTQHGLLGQWRSYLESRLERQVVYVQRDSYRETIDLLRLGQLDFAWICSYPYVYLRDHLRLVAVPLYHGRPYYRAYLIVPEGKPRITNMLQLRGKVFVYADPYSNTGYLVPRYQLRAAGENPDRFFARTFFTYAHRQVIEAVADGVADGGSVDSYIWDSLDLVKHEITSRTWPVSQSEEYGFPPIVAHHAVSRADYEAMQRMLITMRYDAQGKALLKALNLDGFTLSDDKLYANVAKMMAAFGGD